MAGHFEIIDAPNGGYRFRMFDPSGRLLATSTTYATKRSAAAGIRLIRDIAATAHIQNKSTANASFHLARDLSRREHDDGSHPVPATRQERNHGKEQAVRTGPISSRRKEF